MLMISNVLDPSLYEPVRLPLAPAEPLPPWCYTSDQFYRAEVERIFLKTWNFIGRVEMVPTPGSYYALNFVGVPLLVVRAKDNSVKAFLNSCRHRGTPLVKGCGTTKMLTCPYHSWTYATDGRLVSAPGHARCAGFSLAGLWPQAGARSRPGADFIFVTFDDDAPPLSAHLGNIADHLGSYRSRTWSSPAARNTTSSAIGRPTSRMRWRPTIRRRCTRRASACRCATWSNSTGEWVGLHEEHEGTEAILEGTIRRFRSFRG